mmetsp:Transcript_15356/g.45941  ORF Transcript_15356/g.45941 Transcript_15356/m.45941 type:complete len:230 (+) Transcript_15356:455-1144(+)
MTHGGHAIRGVAWQRVTQRDQHVAARLCGVDVDRVWRQEGVLLGELVRAGRLPRQEGDRHAVGTRLLSTVHREVAQRQRQRVVLQSHLVDARHLHASVGEQRAVVVDGREARRVSSGQATAAVHLHHRGTVAAPLARVDTSHAGRVRLLLFLRKGGAQLQQTALMDERPNRQQRVADHHLKVVLQVWVADRLHAYHGAARLQAGERERAVHLTGANAHALEQILQVFDL